MPGTGNVLLDAIAGIGWLSQGGDNHITYYFDNSLGFHNWTAAEKTSYRGAFQAWANVANLTIEEVSSAPAADFDESWVSNAYMQANFGDFGGYHYFPDNPTPMPGYYNLASGYWTTNGLMPGGFGFELFMHEIGHGLGMAHPHDTGMGTGLLPGVTSTFDFGTLRYNQTINTIMSYNDGSTSNTNVVGFSYKATPMAFDVAAIQFLYGANATYHSGDDTYALPDANMAGTAQWVCIWDTGGDDTIRYDGTRNAVIDLHAATLVNGDPNAGGFISRAGFIFGGFTIANGVVVENAFGGGGNDRLTGNDADNRLSGGAGSDTIDGGAGDDTALFGQDLGNYTLQEFGTKILVAGVEGNDTLTGIEHLQFADGTLTPIDDGNPLFDVLNYLSRNTDVWKAGVDPLAHFNAFGWHEGRDPNALFDTSGYLAVYKDIAAAGVNPLGHYDHDGWREGRDPSADFDTTLYLIRNPDVAAAGIDPLAHYLGFGIAEGRAAYAAIGQIVNGFDAEFYLFHNPDVAAAGVDPLAHFNTSGWQEGRNPNANFDTAGYLSHYADVAAASVNPLQHYEQFGWKEGRDPSASFDTLGYLAANPDVAAAHVDPLDHYLTNGIYEGRAIVNDGLWH